ncbi:MAG: tetratricopeptide repeat protein [Anaerolineae bacterium]|nr:tetratricopeptide repeat protein [Anaerolineae bacterium]
MAKAKFNQDNPQENIQDLLKRGTQLLQRGQTQEATAVLEKARTLDGANPDVALNLSSAYILAKKFNQAVEILEPLSQQEPYNAMVWTNLGAAYLGNPILARDEEHEKAIAAFEKAFEINPAAPNVAYNLGLIYRDRQEYETAITWFSKAIQANPTDQDARNIKARLEEKLEEEG